MRSDMASMNPGKAMAQASHASNQFIANHESAGISEWQDEANGFGTVLVLDIRNELEMEKSVRVAELFGLPAGIVHDPTYPVLDGKVVHHVPVNTCAYVFADANSDRYEEMREWLSDYQLHL